MNSFDISKRFEDGWNESVLLLSIGCFVKNELSVDQQLPSSFREFFGDAGESGETDRAKIILFDPDLRRDVPLSVQLNEPDKWEHSEPTLFIRGRLKLVISNSYFDENSKFIGALKSYLARRLPEANFAVAICVFTQPYLRVEENNFAIDFYHNLLSMHRNISPKKIHYFHLAEYGTRSQCGETIVWDLRGEPHDQDKAVLKEVARYKGEGVNFGVAAYANYPGKRFEVKLSRVSGIDYNALQRLVEEEVKVLSLQLIGDVLGNDECRMKDVLAIIRRDTDYG